MLAAHQQVEVLGRRPDLVVELVDVRFGVPADHHMRLGHLPRPLTGDLQRPDASSALLLIERLLNAVNLTCKNNLVTTVNTPLSTSASAHLGRVRAGRRRGRRLPACKPGMGNCGPRPDPEGSPGGTPGELAGGTPALLYRKVRS
jgi:hypothetical protein